AIVDVEPSHCPPTVSQPSDTSHGHWNLYLLEPNPSWFHHQLVSVVVVDNSHTPLLAVIDPSHFTLRHRPPFPSHPKLPPAPREEGPSNGEGNWVVNNPSIPVQDGRQFTGPRRQATPGLANSVP
ncbi:hypothetical protein JMJ77_0008634, partial [Colletotrichum scovillei]